ncbi:MAG: hypothetical protein HZA54_05515 [Planctomycetes bacterium]|nr:hypothetical protein [Planctomycetota bacterium]
MVMPEHGWDARFSGNEMNFLAMMKSLIRTRFADILGDDIELLNQPDGLDRLSAKYLARLQACSQPGEARTRAAAATYPEAELVIA